MKIFFRIINNLLHSNYISDFKIIPEVPTKLGIIIGLVGGVHTESWRIGKKIKYIFKVVEW